MRVVLKEYLPAISCGKHETECSISNVSRVSRAENSSPLEKNFILLGKTNFFVKRITYIISSKVSARSKSL